jgi:hypothetical protein
VNTFNGTELAGRKILVREDREDRDVKQFNRENGIEGTPPPPRPQRTRAGGAKRPGGRPPREQDGAEPAAAPEEPGESSGLQVRRRIGVQTSYCLCQIGPGALYSFHECPDGALGCSRQTETGCRFAHVATRRRCLGCGWDSGQGG